MRDFISKFRNRGKIQTAYPVSYGTTILSKKFSTLTLVSHLTCVFHGNLLFEGAVCKSRFRKSEQGDKWSFCLTAGKIGPGIRSDHE